LLAQWRAAGADRVVVIHPPDEQAPVVRELDRLGVPPEDRAPNRSMERGMMGSVVTAAGFAPQLPSLTHLIIALGDQPHLRVETLREIIAACATSPGKLVQLMHDGKAGHPLALPVHVCASLNSSPDQTLRDFLSRQNVAVFGLTCHDSGVLLDVDTPDDYARASQLAD
jgi:CTP:molybdopterin cytidylyltransferase MocA